MVVNNSAICPACGADAKHYDTVKRVARTKYGKKYIVTVKRIYCPICGAVRRITPVQLYSHKQYEAAIIEGFLSGELDISMIEFEDYPTEQTIQNWIRSLGKR